MFELIEPAAEWCALLVETLGIAIITVTAVYVLGVGLYRRWGAVFCWGWNFSWLRTLSTPWLWSSPSKRSGFLPVLY